MGELIEEIGTMIIATMLGGLCAGIVSFCIAAGIIIAKAVF